MTRANSIRAALAALIVAGAGLLGPGAAALETRSVPTFAVEPGWPKVPPTSGSSATCPASPFGCAGRRLGACIGRARCRARRRRAEPRRPSWRSDPGRQFRRGLGRRRAAATSGPSASTASIIDPKGFVWIGGINCPGLRLPAGEAGGWTTSCRKWHDRTASSCCRSATATRSKWQRRHRRTCVVPPTPWATMRPDQRDVLRGRRLRQPPRHRVRCTRAARSSGCGGYLRQQARWTTTKCKDVTKPDFQASARSSNFSIVHSRVANERDGAWPTARTGGSRCSPTTAVREADGQDRHPVCTQRGVVARPGATQFARRRRQGLADEIDILRWIAARAHSPHDFKKIGGIDIVVHHYDKPSQIRSRLAARREHPCLPRVPRIGLPDRDHVEHARAARFVAPHGFHVGKSRALHLIPDHAGFHDALRIREIRRRFHRRRHGPGSDSCGVPKRFTRITG